MNAPKKPRTMPAVVTSAHAASIKAVDVVPALLSELQKAEQIILAMLNAMTSAQKSKVHARLDAAGVSGEGMTRHHERRAVLDAADAMSAPPPPSDARPRDLTPTALELVTTYAGMTPWARSLLLDTARQYAKEWPINRAPALRLIVGGAS
ncbi:MAG: hypothetical protein JWL97_4340 [Gemmatimonadales bacterium]|nr:hypothetical protein [Gemmatimonadales bacterium]